MVRPLGMKVGVTVKVGGGPGVLVGRRAALIARLAATFDLGLSNLFLVPDPMLAVLLNYGAAALAWLLITAVVVRLASRIG